MCQLAEGPRASFGHAVDVLGNGRDGFDRPRRGLVCRRCQNVAEAVVDDVATKARTLAATALQHGLGTDDVRVQKRLTRQEASCGLAMGGRVEHHLNASHHVSSSAFDHSRSNVFVYRDGPLSG